MVLTSRAKEGEIGIEDNGGVFTRVQKSGYERRPLIEEFKRRLNSVIRHKLIEVEQSP